MDLGEFLHFRVHTDELELDELMTFLNEQCDIHFAVKEYGKSNREHIHSCLKLKVAKQTFIDRMKKKFPMIKGNGYYSLSKLKKGYDTNARYCYKGKANDYPDVIQSIHSKEQWLKYYNAYWEEFKAKHPVPESVPLVSKVKSKTFMMKVRDEVLEYDGLVSAIWSHYGYKSDFICPTDVETMELCQNYLAKVLYKNLGKSVKNIDDLIFERLYRGLLASILVECPEPIYEKQAINLLDKFRKKL